MELHSSWSASSMYRWQMSACPGSKRMSQGIPQTTSTYAAEGSAAHFLAETCLRKGHDAGKYLNRIVRPVDRGHSLLKRGAETQDGDYPVTENMVDAVQVYLDTIREDMKDGWKDMRVETRFSLDWLHPGLYGTNDACLAEPWGRLRVYDYKHGAGYPVEVEQNPQLLYYALGAAYGEEYEDVELVVVQPRARHRDGPVRRWTLSMDDLLLWGKDVLLPSVEMTKAHDAPVHAGDWCKFCPALPVCPAIQEKALEVAKADFRSMPLPSPERLTYQELTKVLEAQDVLKKWLASVEAHAQGLLEKGEQLPGWKLVHKKTLRRWAYDAEPEVVTRLFKHRADIFEKKLLSPAQMEKFIVKKGLDVDLSDLVEKPEGGLVIAPESDRRPGVAPAGFSEFTAIEG